jgi:hypothetical protein
MLFWPAPAKPTRQGHQVGPRGLHQPNPWQNNQPQADSCHVDLQSPRYPITKRVSVHIKAKVSQVIGAVLTTAVYFYLYGVTVRLGSAQLAYLHAVSIFATFVFLFFRQK